MEDPYPTGQSLDPKVWKVDLSALSSRGRRKYGKEIPCKFRGEVRVNFCFWSRKTVSAIGVRVEDVGLILNFHISQSFVDRGTTAATLFAATVSKSWRLNLWHWIRPGKGSTAQRKWSRVTPAWKSQNPFASRPIKVNIKLRGCKQQGARARYVAVLPPCISIVWSPNHPWISQTPRERGLEHWCSAKVVEKCFWHFFCFWSLREHCRKMTVLVLTLFDKFWHFLTWPLSAGAFCGPLGILPWDLSIRIPRLGASSTAHELAAAPRAETLKQY